MKLTQLIIGMFLLATSAQTLAYADDCPCPWQVRARALGVIPKGSSSDLIHFNSGKIDNFSNSLAPEIDVNYLYSDNLILEFSVAQSRHSFEASDATIAGIGRASLVLANITMTYHICPFWKVDPYIGLGVNYTLFYDFDHRPVDAVRYTDSAGVVGQLGADIYVDCHWSINLDLKYVYIDNAVHLKKDDVNDSACVRLSPWIIGAGIGYRF